MGCCGSIQSTEEENILSFFQLKLKENNFNFSIKNYEENYEKISKFSGNNFKRLCKKQIVRLNFINLLKEDENTLINNDKQDGEDIQKILYHIIILTILLENKLEEFPKDVIIIENINNDINQNNLINLKRELIELGYNLFNIEYLDKNNNKIIIYHLIKLFNLCFQDFHDVNNYISIESYINKIKSFIDNEIFIDEEEHYLFVKDNLLTLGEFFNNNNYLAFDDDIPNIIIKISVMVLNHWHEYLINNIQIIKEIINKNIRNATYKIINSVEYNNITENKMNNINAIQLESLNNDNINDDIIHKDIKLIFRSLYNIFKKIIQDIYSGKSILIELENQLFSEKDSKYEFNRIIIFLLFYECYIKDDEKLILCFMENIIDLYIGNEKIDMKDDINIYYDIALNSYYLVYKNIQLSKQYISLITQIFIEEMKINDNKNKYPILIIQLIQIYQKKDKTNKLVKLFFYFILNISRYYNNIVSASSEDEIKKQLEFNEKIIKNILSNLNNIIKTYFINNASNNGKFPSIKEKNGVLNTYNNYYNVSTNNATYNLNNEENIVNNFKISIIYYEIITTNFFHFNNLKDEILENIEFYLYFHCFIINNMNILILINDFEKRERIYNNLFKIITQLELILILETYKENSVIINTEKDENYLIENYINDIIISLQIILKINELNDSNNYIQDCYLFYKSIANNIKSLLNMQKSNDNNYMIFQIDSFNLKIIYSIIFFILCQFINLINIPNSITKQNDEIIDLINKINPKYGNLLTKINISNFINYNNSSENQNYIYLKELFSKENEEIFSINSDLFKQILDIIYTKLFGTNSSLNIFFDNQIQNSNYFYNINNITNNSLSKLSDNITEINDNSLINQYKDNNLDENIMEDISIQMLDSKKKSVNKSNDKNNNIINNSNSIINSPFQNEIISKEKFSNSFIIDDNQYSNIKV